MIKLEVGLCSQARSIMVTFSTEAQAVEYVKRNADRFSFLEDEASPLSPEDHPVLLAVLYPECVHGLSLTLCVGPEHYPTD